MNSDLTPSPYALRIYAQQLESRYPGIAVHVEWVDDREHGRDYTGWLTRFTGSVRALLAHRLTSQAELDYSRLPYAKRRRGDLNDEFGHHRFVSEYDPKGYKLPAGSMSVGVHVPSTQAEEEKGVTTKKTQALAAKLLKRAVAMKGAT